MVSPSGWPARSKQGGPNNFECPPNGASIGIWQHFGSSLDELSAKIASPANRNQHSAAVRLSRLDEIEREAIRHEGPDRDDPAVMAALELVRLKLTLLRT
ncbi:MAG: hypothetical protein ACLPLP_17855 [Mycobacterium sp.]